MLSESHTVRFRGGGADPLVRSRPLADLLRPSTKADEGVGRGPGGPPHQDSIQSISTQAADAPTSQSTAMRRHSIAASTAPECRLSSSCTPTELRRKVPCRFYLRSPYPIR